MSANYTVFTDFDGNDGLTPIMNKLTTRAGKTKKALNSISGGFEKLGKSAAKMAVPSGLAFGVLTNELLKWDDALVELEKRLPDGANAETFERVKKTISDIAKETGIAKDEIAAVTSEAGKMSVPMEKWAAFTELTVKSFKALELENLESTTTSLLKLNAQMGLGFDMSKMTDAAAQLNLVADSTGSSAEGILRFTDRVAGAAKMADLSTQQLFSLAGASIEVSESSEGAAMAMRKVIETLGTSAKWTDKKTLAFQNLGFEGNKLAADFKANPIAVLRQLSTAIKDSGDASGYTARLFDMQSSRVGGLLNNIDKLESTYHGLSNQAVANIKFNQEYSRSLSKLRTQFSQLKQALVDPFVKESTITSLKKFTDESIKPAVEGFARFVEKSPDVVLGIGAIMAASVILAPMLITIAGGFALMGALAGIVGTAFTALGVVVGVLSAGFGFLTFAMGPVAATVLGIVVAIGLIVGAAYAAGKAIQWLGDKYDRLTGKKQDWTDNVLGGEQIQYGAKNAGKKTGKPFSQGSKDLFNNLTGGKSQSAPVKKQNNGSFNGAVSVEVIGAPVKAKTASVKNFGNANIGLEFA